MDLERLFRDIGKIGAKVFFNKEEKIEQNINLDQIGPKDILKIILKRLVYEGEYNKAENILFEELNKDNSEEMYQIAVDFYNMLLEKSEEELLEKSFTREEIYQGLEDIKNICRK
jgi:hypothetical protein